MPNPALLPSAADKLAQTKIRDREVKEALKAQRETKKEEREKVRAPGEESPASRPQRRAPLLGPI